MKYEAVVIGTSAGGLHALTKILEALPGDFPLPIIVVQHRAKDSTSSLEELLNQKCEIEIRQADEKEKIQKSTVYFAPPDYHLLVERNHTFSLSFEPPVNYSRPSIDVLFDSAARVYKDKLAGIILTGASIDGANGIKTIKQNGGTTIAQDPATAQYPFMPKAAIETGSIEFMLSLEEITAFLINIL